MSKNKDNAGTEDTEENIWTRSYSLKRILKRILRKRLPASKTERTARQASPKTDQWMCTKLEKGEKINGSDRCEKEQKRRVIKMNKKKKKRNLRSKDRRAPARVVAASTPPFRWQGH